MGMLLVWLGGFVIGATVTYLCMFARYDTRKE